MILILTILKIRIIKTGRYFFSFFFLIIFSRQVVVNGKLLTLVPFQGGAPGSNPQQRIATLQHRPPPGKMPISRPGGSPIVVHPSHQSLLKQRQIQAQNQIRIPLVQKPNIQGLSGGRLPLPANLDDVQCDFCHVKLPRSIIYMHMKMRHKELMQTAKTPTKTPAASAKSGNNSEVIQCTPEIVFDDNTENNASSNNSDLMELNPTSSEIDLEMEQEPDEDPLADPLAL